MSDASAMETDKRVCAVVVTYNRKALLSGCLESLLAQSYALERIIVIDNASMDGTETLFGDSGAFARPQISHIRLAANTGGAGGFHEGFRRALEEDWDWLWVMDDDGLPHREALESLLNAPSSAGKIRGPVVLARESMLDLESNQLAFGGSVDTAAGPIIIRTRADIARESRDGILYGYACVFNGVLIERDAVEQIGLPKKEFFIWGDEWDYIFRARHLGIEMATVIQALYWHPLERAETAKVRLLGVEYELPRARSRSRNYLIIRNYAYLAARHRGLFAWIRHTAKYLIFHVGAEGCFSSLDVIRYSWEGLRVTSRGMATCMSEAT